MEESSITDTLIDVLYIRGFFQGKDYKVISIVNFSKLHKVNIYNQTEKCSTWETSQNLVAYILFPKIKCLSICSLLTSKSFDRFEPNFAYLLSTTVEKL